MRVHFLSKRAFRPYCFTFPTRVFSRQIKEAGISTRIFYKPDDPGLTDCDVLGVLSDHFGIEHIIHQPNAITEFLERLSQQVKILVWFDTTDGACATFEPAFALVKRYFHKQLFKDRELYKTAYHERAYHLDYYYQHNEDELEKYGTKARITSHRGLEPAEIDKLRLSWNIGLGDYRSIRGQGRRFLSYWPLARFQRKISDTPSISRPIHISYRVGTGYSFPAVTFHRTRIRQEIASLAAQGGYDIRYEGRLPYPQYLQEISRTRIAPSPFGWGEICWRDFEIMLGGAMLYKPDMEHLETWPNYFEKNVTYISHAWDFTGIQAQLAGLLADPDRCQTVATAAQNRYLDSLSPAGGHVFAQHFARMIEEIT